MVKKTIGSATVNEIIQNFGFLDRKLNLSAGWSSG